MHHHVFGMCLGLFGMFLTVSGKFLEVKMTIPHFNGFVGPIKEWAMGHSEQFISISGWVS